MNIILQINYFIKKILRPTKALHYLDYRLEKYLNFNNGFFIEAGANDGITQSNTYYFEKYRHWNGLLIEPVKNLAKTCKLNRPRSITENYALVSDQYTKKYIKLCNLNLMSFVEGAFTNHYKEKMHIQIGKKIQNISSSHVCVKTSTLKKLLVKHKVKKIDLLVLDVEGYEAEVLQGLDILLYSPRFILAEMKNGKKVKNILKKHYNVVEQFESGDVLFQKVC